MDERLLRLSVVAFLFTMFYTTALIGLFTGFMFAVYPHEAGHYFFAYLGNRSAIDKMEFYQGRLVRELMAGDVPSNLTIRGRVSYKGNVRDVFSGIWIDLVELGGLAFSLATLSILIYLLNSIKPVKNDFPRAFAFLFLLAFFFGVVLDTYPGWWMDGIKLMKYHKISDEIGRRVIVLTSTMIAVGGLFLSYRYLEKFLQFFPQPDRFWQELQLPKIFARDLGAKKQKKN